MNDDVREKTLFVVVVLVALLVYYFTACRTVYWGDGIELTCDAAVLGVAHPTGYPLFSLLGKAFSQLPIGTVAFRLNLMSAVAAALAAGLSALCVWKLLPLAGLLETGRPMARWLFAAIAGWTVAMSRTFWYQAGITEVYLLNAAIFAGVFLLVLLAVESRSFRRLLASCFLCGLGMGNHTMAMILAPAVAGVFLWFVIPGAAEKEPRKRRGRRRGVGESKAKRTLCLAGAAVGLGALGLLTYAYLPVRAADNPPLNWGDPSTVGRFLWSVRGGEFRRFYFLKVPPGRFYDGRVYPPGIPFDSRTYAVFFRHRLGEWLRWTGDQLFGLPPEQAALRGLVGFLFLGASFCGWWLLARRLGIFAVFIAVVFLLALLAVFTYSIRDIEGYFFPLHLVAVVCFFSGVAALFRWTEEHLLLRKADFLPFLFLVFPATALWRNHTFCNHTNYDAAERYGRTVLSLLPPDAMILTQGDYDIEPLWYQQIVERRRRDVVVFGSNFLATPGYEKYFLGRYDPPVEARYFAETPDEKTYFDALANDIIKPNIALRPMYSTWYDPRMGVGAEKIDLPLLREAEVLNVPERIFFPPPYVFKLTSQRTRK